MTPQIRTGEILKWKGLQLAISATIASSLSYITITSLDTLMLFENPPYLKNRCGEIIRSEVKEKNNSEKYLEQARY